MEAQQSLGRISQRVDRSRPTSALPFYNSWHPYFRVADVSRARVEFDVRCGSGPNVATTDESDDGGIFRDVYKPASAAALLSHICGLTIPDAAVKAWLRRMYAVRAMRANKAQEAHALLTEALTLAAPLKGDGSHLISLLLDERADVSEGLLRDAEAAAADRARAAQIRQLQQKQAAAAAA